MTRWNVSPGEATKLVSELLACYRTQVAHAYTSFSLAYFVSQMNPIHTLILIL
jgi:hypothetical protein